MKTTNPHVGTPVIQLNQVKNVFVHSCVAAPGTETFLRVDELSTDDVTMGNNDLKQAVTAVETVHASTAVQPKDGEQK